MTARRPPPEIPTRILGSPEMAKACHERDFAVVFDLLKRKAGIYPSEVARACDLTPGRVGDVMAGRRWLREMSVIERIADGLKIPGRMLGLADREWEQTPADPSASKPTSTRSQLVLPGSWGADAPQPFRSGLAGIEPEFLAMELSASLPGHYRTANLLGAQHTLDMVSRHAQRIERTQYETGGSSLDLLLNVGARVAEFLGWLYQDLGDHRSAQFWSDRAMEWTMQTGDDLMTSYLWFRKSNHATQRRMPDTKIA